MPSNNGGAKPGAGRPPGRKNKVTRDRLERLEREYQESRRTGKKLAVEVMDEFMQAFAGLAAQHQPAGAQPDEVKFEKYGRLAIEVAIPLAQHQTPRLRAIMMPTAAPEADSGRLTKTFTLSIFEHGPAGKVIEHKG